MAPIKFEDNIREKLEGREIEPSVDAWKKLSERLDENSKRKNNYIVWYAIAASIIGVLIAVSVFSSSGDKLNEKSTNFVDVNTSERDDLNENVPNLVENTSEEKNKAIVVAEEPNTLKLKKINTGKEKFLPKKKGVVLENTESKVSEAIAKNDTENQAGRMSRIAEEIMINNELLIDKRIDELVAQREQFQQVGTAASVVSEEEINTLLSNAAHKIKTQKTNDSNKIDPAALLGDVESEMENSFREKVFTALGDSYNIIKTAVVDRNN
jgi:hypothetical protein